jgi:DNA topoisomerase IA
MDISDILKRAYLRENEDVKIEVEHEGILEVPKGKNVEDLSEEHFKSLVKKKGYASIAHALTNLIVWNREKNKVLSHWADSMQNKLKSWVDKERESNPKFG